MSDRDQEMRELAEQFALAQKRAVSFDKEFNEAERQRNAARHIRDELDKKLKSYVGRNVPRRVINVGDGEVVLIQLNLHNNDSVYVSLESVL